MENVERANKRLKTATENHQRDLNAQLGILANKEKILKERLDGLNAKKAKTAQDNGDVDADGDDLIEINAGGKIIAAKRSTLAQFEGTRLEAVFSGRWDKKLLRDCNDRVFLDVNPSCFQAIVDYLNELAISPDDNPPLPPSFDDETKDIFRHQLELFGIEDKIRIVELESNIVKLPTAVVIQNWMKEVGPACDFELLYRSSRDGRNDCTFHSKCDDKGPTLTVIETSDGSIFGGYTDAPWSPKHGYSQSEKAFLFFIPGSKNKSPSIMKIKKVNVDKAICCNSSSGPTFGADLRVRGSNIYLAFGNTYEATPSEEIYSSQMAIKDMEVFAVTFTKEPGNHNNTGRLQVPKKTVTFSKGVNEAMNEKMDSLNTLEAELLRRENGFNDERKFTAVFANGKPEDVVTLNVSGSIMLVAKSSLMIRKKSHLATVATKSKKQSKDSGTKDISEWGHEDVVAWLKGLKGVPESVVAIFKNNKIEGIELVALGKEGMIDLGVTRKPTIFVILEEMKKLQSAGGSNATLIEHSPYCFEKIVDYLRLMRSYEKGLVKTKPACPVVRESERARFEKLVKHYFPRNSTKFILC